MDIVTRLADGRMLTGAIKWSDKPVGAEVHGRHMRDLDRLARAGQKWAYEALEPEAIVLHVASGGFKKGFLQRARQDHPHVHAWSLTDIYP